MAPTDDLRRDLTALTRDVHGVDSRLVRVEVELGEHRKQSQQQHDDVMAAINDLRRAVTPPGPDPRPPSLPPGALSTLPPGPTLEPATERSSDPGALTISPRKVGPWLRLLIPYLIATGVGGGALKGCETLSARPEPTEVQP